MYDTHVGRFIQLDPEGFQAGDLNLYRYVDNAPTKASDPSGREPFVPVNMVGGPSEAEARWRSERVRRRGNVGIVFSGGEIKATLEWFSDRERDDLLFPLAAAYRAVRQLGTDLRVDDRDMDPNPVRQLLVGGPAPPPRLLRLADLDNTVVQRLQKWFGRGVGNNITPDQLVRIRLVVRKVRDGLVRDTIPFVNVYNPRERSVVAHVTRWPLTGEKVYLNYPLFWEGTPRRRAMDLVHELTHYFADTDDHGYIRNALGDAPPTYEKNGRAVEPTVDQLIDNADTYAGLLDEYYLPAQFPPDARAPVIRAPAR